MMAFVIVAAIMVVVALTFVLLPLRRAMMLANNAAIQTQHLYALKQAPDSGVINPEEFAAKCAAVSSQPLPTIYVPANSRSSTIAAALIILLLPTTATGLYYLLGNPDALDPLKVTVMTKGEGPDMQQAMDSLANKLKQNPNDAEGWVLLGRAYKVTQRLDEALTAFKYAHDLLPDNADITLQYVEILVLTSTNHRIDGEPRALVEQALAVNPKNQLGLWLLGISDYQAGQFDEAVANWDQLLSLLPKNSDEAHSVEQQIARAQQQAGGASSAPTSTTTSTLPPPNTATASTTSEANSNHTDTTSPKLTVHVQLDAKLRDKLAPNDTLFVYAKAFNGPPMPLSIQRINASQLPTTVILDESKGMLPNMKLSMFPQVVIGARISKSGNAIAQSGDLQTLSQPVAVGHEEPIELTIDQVVP